MASLADAPDLVGFFSYSREDDEGSGGRLSKLRERIQEELRGQLGRTKRDLLAITIPRAEWAVVRHFQERMAVWAVRAGRRPANSASAVACANASIRSNDLG